MNEMSSPSTANFPLNAAYDPWDPIHSLKGSGEHRLTGVEMTVTTLCNMRCEHCAVGDSLTYKEGSKIPLELMLKRLDEIDSLQTLSLTGGEPSYLEETVREWIIPVLKYAKARGIRTQLNSNLTLDCRRYEEIAPYLDVMHISFNYTGATDFHKIGFARSGHFVSEKAAHALYERMMENAVRLSSAGLFVSAETMINMRTVEHLPEIHGLIAEMGCRRHEVHPMYPSSFAKELPLLSLARIRGAILRLLDARNPKIWMLFGTLPFYLCSPDPSDRKLLKRLHAEPNVTVRNDPDGRNRLNVNLFSGDVFVTDFAEVPPLGNVFHDRLEQVFGRWLDHPLHKSVDCRCLQADCCGPNLLVKHAYYQETDFETRQAILSE